VPLVDIIGEFDLNSTLAQMQNARYTPESTGRVDSRANTRQGTETLSVLTTRRRSGPRSTRSPPAPAASSPSTHPIWNLTCTTRLRFSKSSNISFSRAFLQVRVLLSEPARVMRDSNRFVPWTPPLELHRYPLRCRPSSQRASAYLIADDRPSCTGCAGCTWDGIVTSTILPSRLLPAGIRHRECQRGDQACE